MTKLSYPKLSVHFPRKFYEQLLTKYGKEHITALEDFRGLTFIMDKTYGYWLMSQMKEIEFLITYLNMLKDNKRFGAKPRKKTKLVENVSQVLASIDTNTTPNVIIPAAPQLPQPITDIFIDDEGKTAIIRKKFGHLFSQEGKTEIVINPTTTVTIGDNSAYWNDQSIAKQLTFEAEVYYD